MEFNIVNPKTKSDLLEAIRKESHFRFGAGYTDLLMELRKKPEEGLTVINLSQVKDVQFNGIKKMAKEKGITLLELGRRAEKDKSIDGELDERQIEKAVLSLLTDKGYKEAKEKVNLQLPTTLCSS